jgi:predicted dithiol-disulfide oxidoreductase (DUF899 family)
MTPHPIVPKAEWLEARKRLLTKEKEFTRLRDQLSQERQKLPWLRLDKQYNFETQGGRATLGDLFADRSQLVVYHFMFGPSDEAGCKSCSFWADNFDGIVLHLNQRDVTFTAISRAPLTKLRAFAERLGWSFPWASSLESDFNFDFGVSFKPEEIAQGQVSYNYASHKAYGSEMPGISVFAKAPDGAIFHTYSCYSRGLDMLNTAYHYLDLVPKGRDEIGLPYSMAWLRHRDQYGA